MPDIPMPKLQQVSGRELGAKRLSRGNDGYRRSRVSPDRDSRNIAWQISKGLGHDGLRRDDDYAGDGLLSQPADSLLDGATVKLLQRDDTDEVSDFSGRLLETDQGGGGSVKSGVVANDANGLRLAGD